MKFLIINNTNRSNIHENHRKSEFKHITNAIIPIQFGERFIFAIIRIFSATLVPHVQLGQGFPALWPLPFSTERSGLNSIISRRSDAVFWQFLCRLWGLSKDCFRRLLLPPAPETFLFFEMLIIVDLHSFFSFRKRGKETDRSRSN